MKKILVIILIAISLIFLVAAGVDTFKEIYFEYDSGFDTYYNRISNGKGDSLFFQLAGGATEYQLFPFPDSTITTQLTVIGTENEVTVSAANDTATIGLADTVTVIGLNVTNNIVVGGGMDATGSITGSNLSGTNTGDQDLSGYVPYTGANSTLNMGTQDIKQSDNAKYYFGTGDNAQLYFDGTNLHIDPTNVIITPTVVQSLFSNSDSTFTADGDIKDWSGNGYDASLDSSYCITNVNSDNSEHIDIGSKKILSNMVGKSYFKASLWVKFDASATVIANNEVVFVGAIGSTVFVELWWSKNAGQGLTFWVNSNSPADGGTIHDNFQPTVGTWYYIEAIADFGNNTTQLYVDGVLDCENTGWSFVNVPIIDKSATYNDYIFNQKEGSNASADASISNITFENESGTFFELPFAEGGGNLYYDIVGEDSYSFNYSPTVQWDTKQSNYHYNLTYGFTDDTTYIPYNIGGTPISVSGTNHPAGNWHNGAETQICFNPLDIVTITSTTGWTSSDYFTYDEIIDYIGNGYFDLDTDTNKKYNMQIYESAVNVPSTNNVAIGEMHTPNAQVSVKSRGTTSGSYNAHFLNNDGDSLFTVRDDGLVYAESIISDNFPDSTITDITGSPGGITVSEIGHVSKDYTITLQDSVHIQELVADSAHVTGDLTVDGNFYPLAVCGKMVEANESGSGITCTDADTYYQWVTMDSTHSTEASQGIVYVDSLHCLTVPYDGKYFIMVTASVALDATGLVHIALAKNDTIGVYGINHYEFKFVNQDITMAFNQLPTLEAGDKLTVKFSSDANGDVVKVYHCVFTVMYLGRQE